MPTHTPQRSEQLQQGLQNAALLVRRGRELNGLSQQNIHVLCQILGINLYNSQISHIEQAKLVLKPATFLELEKLNFAIDDKKISHQLKRILIRMYARNFYKQHPI